MRRVEQTIVSSRVSSAGVNWRGMQTECIEQAEQRVTGWVDEAGASATLGCIARRMGTAFEATDGLALAACMLFS